MKNIYINLFRFLNIAAILSISLSACKKFVDVPLPINQVTAATVFSDSAGAESAVVGLYAVQVTTNLEPFLNGNVSILPGLSADELDITTATTDDGEFAANAISTSNYSNQSNWDNAYNVIYQANSVIEHLDKAEALSDALKERLIAEAKFIRGLNYFYLTCEYGPVPLALTANYEITAILPRSDMAVVYAQVIQDLKDAQAGLPVAYPSTGKVRANKWSATALLARAYLYQHDWQDALQQSTTVINQGGYALTNISETYIPDNTEAILQFVSSNTLFVNTIEGYYFIPASQQTAPAYPLRTELLNAFEAGDQRKVQWVGSETVDGTTYYYPYKYKTNSIPPGTPKTEYNIVFRLAEQYLIRAEARAQMENLTEAIGDVDVIRARAGLPLLAVIDPSPTKQDLLNTIYHENQIEYFAEWGHRWFDLKRTGLADSVLSAVKGADWQSTDVLYPIPLSEIQKDPFLTQNAGYK